MPCEISRNWQCNGKELMGVREIISQSGYPELVEGSKEGGGYIKILIISTLFIAACVNF